MKRLILTGGDVITPLSERFTDLWIADGVVEKLAPADRSLALGATLMDVSGCYVTPGLIDLQLNGGPECNFWADPDAREVEKFSHAQTEKGVTAFLPTLITDDVAHLKKNLNFLETLGVGKNEGGSPVDFGRKGTSKARMPGVHLEGPCISPQRPGVHPPQWLKPLTLEVVKEIISPSVMLMTVAPELDPEGKVLDYLIGRGIHISLGHSNATAAEAAQAFNRGVLMVTHTFNALPPLHHRAPGAVTAALLDERVTCCVIADGLHVEPLAVKLLCRSKGVGKTLLVTDAAQIGTTGGGLVGSSIDLGEAVRNIVSWGVASFPEAVRMATFNAAECLRMSHKIGHLAPGKLADVVVWDKQSLSIRCVIVAGEMVHERN